VFAIYPRVTQLDFTGPYEVFWRLPGAQCVLASAAGGDIETDSGIVYSSVRRLAQIEQCALVCVPGGFGTIEAMEDQEFIAQLRRLAASARYVTSVCTGSLVLGAAGLLKAGAPRRIGLGATDWRPSAPRLILHESFATATSSQEAALPQASILRSQSWRRSLATIMLNQFN
jgi:putative intracellular protease/amidase